ncbi:MAG TPA: sigma-70 family RNA polymerase sigma factor [Thermoleophilia bacterium]|nr:sigma-70 family RNA polymerase sigma factor [Thermoleophilia bacterium]
MTLPFALAVEDIPARDITEEDVKLFAVRASNDDPAAFGMLYRLYFPQLFTFINFRVSSREDAEDLANAVFEKALRAIERYQPKPAQFSTWLYTIAKNCIIDHYRRRRLPVDSEADAAVIPSTDLANDPMPRVLSEERKRTLREALLDLTPDQREVVECRFFFELSIQETAAAMLKTEGAVKALQFRALEGLQKLLTEDIIL